MQIIAALVLTLATGCQAFAAEPATGPHNVILVTLDGVRVQEVFGGLDEAAATHDEQQVYSDMAAMRERFGGASPAARRQRLMPHFWTRLAPQGVVLGNPGVGNHVRVQNRMLWSTPGYTELMTGGPRAEVTGNEEVRYPWPTVLEFAREALGLGFAEVAQIGSWDGFALAAASRDDAFLMVGADQSVPPPWGTPEIDLLNDLRKEVMGLWEEGSNDALTYRMARAFLQKNQPRVLWLALVNSDDWAHADRYDRYLAYLHRADAMLGDLWETVQSMEAYRGRTTLMVTTDHGRGRTGEDWQEHELTIPGSADIWLAVIGPHTPDVGEAVTPGTAYQGQVAATLLQFLDLDYRRWNPQALPPVAGTRLESLGDCHTGNLQK